MSLIIEHNTVHFWYDQILINIGALSCMCPKPTSMSSSTWSSFAMASSLSDSSVSCVGWTRPNTDEFEFFNTLSAHTNTHFYSLSLLTAFLLMLVLATIFFSDLWTLELPKNAITEVGFSLGGVGVTFVDTVGWELFTPPFEIVFGALIGDLIGETFASFSFPEFETFLPLAVPFSLGLCCFRVTNVSSESGKIKQGQKKKRNTNCDIHIIFTALYYTWGNLLADSLTRIRHESYWLFLHCGGRCLFSALFGLLLLLVFLRVYDKMREIL